MTRKIQVENLEAGILTDAASVVLEDPTGAYGIREKISGTVVIAAGEDTVKASTGIYEYDISDLDPTIEYDVYWKITRISDNIAYTYWKISIVTDIPPDITGKSYATVADGETYFTERLNSDAWDDASEANKAKSLITATRIIDRLNFKGTKTSENQTLQFPRNDDATIPEDIKFACLEVALALLDGVDPEIEFDNLSMVSQNYANVRSTYDRSIPNEHIVAGIPSVSAWRYLKPYLRDGHTVDLSRVS